MSFEIEDGIPIPASARQSGPGRRLKYPLDQLDIGQSFMVPVPDNPDPSVYESEMQRTTSRLSNAANRYRKQQDPNFYAVVRRVEGGVRLWRTQPKNEAAASESEAEE